MCFIDLSSFEFGLCIALYFLIYFCSLCVWPLGLWVCHSPKTPVLCPPQLRSKNMVMAGTH